MNSLGIKRKKKKQKQTFIVSDNMMVNVSDGEDRSGTVYSE